METTKKLHQFIGLNERRSRSDLQTKEGRFVAGAENVDMVLPGAFRGRSGYTKLIPGADMHSLWVSAKGRAFVVSAGQLCALDVRNRQLTPLAMTVPTAATLSFADLPDGDIAVSDARTLLRIKPDNSLQPVVAAAPAPAPTATADAGANTYLYCFAYVDALGVVGLCTQSKVVVGGVPTFNVPAPPAGYRTQVYVSHPNGEVMYLAAESSGGVLVCGQDRIGGECLTLNQQALMPGSAMCVHGGRLYVARGSVIYYSHPYSMGVMSPANFLPMPAEVTVMAPTPTGCFIVADKTYWLQGSDPLAAQLSVINEHTGVARSLARLSDGRPVWASSDGVVVGSPDGAITSLTSEVAVGQDAPSGTTGATLPMERNGAPQIISKRQQAGFGRAGITMTAE